MPSEPVSSFRSALRALQNTDLPFVALNCFLPGNIKVTGPDADMRILENYATTVLQRAEEAGIQTIVFGSGGARAVPDGFDHTTARRQILDFCGMLGPLAARHGVTIVIEPLRKKETNTLNTVSESAALVRELDHPNIRLLVDSFHILWDGDCLDHIVANGDLIRHVHVATVPERLPPGMEECDLRPFFQALIRAGYNWRISIEATIKDPAKELPIALDAMTKLLPKR